MEFQETARYEYRGLDGIRVSLCDLNASALKKGLSMDSCMGPLPSFRRASGRNPGLRHVAIPTAWIPAQSLSRQALGREPCRNDEVGSVSPMSHNASLETKLFHCFGCSART